MVACHERLQGNFGVAGKLDHYLELLKRKPGALRNSLPLRQERERGAWPSCFDELWAAIEARYGASEAARRGCPFFCVGGVGVVSWGSGLRSGS